MLIKKDYFAKMRHLQRLRKAGKINASDIARFINNPDEYEKIIGENDE